MIEPNNIYLGDCYELIKQIPDKSVDLVYIDIPYQFQKGGGAGAFGPKNRPYREDIKFEASVAKMKLKAEELKQKMDNATSKTDYEKWHSQRGNILKKINYKGVDTSIDYKILDEFVRVLKYIYIYIYGVVKSRYLN